jgi:hypothetical protein
MDSGIDGLEIYKSFSEFTPYRKAMIANGFLRLIASVRLRR